MERLSLTEASEIARRNDIARRVLSTIPGLEIDLSNVVDGVTDTPVIIVNRLVEVHGSFFNDNQIQQLREGGIEV